ncbi:MAG: dihydrolipoamide acetyltransferase family protein [Bacteriovoracales bacterium]|nr:dihydrolipoamide acetyltransferase family protein [Bacteriovoracales bacterium]
MARTKVVMPQMGESVTTGTITKWHKKPGESIEIDDILLDISTDKVESEIPSSVSGRLEIIHFPEGETVDVGTVIAEIEEDQSVPFSSPDSEIENREAKKGTTAPVDETVVEQRGASDSPTGEGPLRRFYTPLVKAMASKEGVSMDELAQLKGSGAGGRVNKNDLLRYMESKKSASRPSSPEPSPSAPPLTSFPLSSKRDEIIPMDNMRKAIARNMVESKKTSPHVNSVEEVDMSRLVKFRETFKKEFLAQEGFPLTYTHFIMHAIVSSLREFPLVNASLDGDQIVVKKDINLGLAVAVPGNGLVVPVIKGADGLNITGLARATHELAHKARAKKLTLDELQGGTFTLSNVGSFGTLFATPVILQPQVGIMAAGLIKKRAVVVEGAQGDAIAIRSLMYLTHTYDHRLIDGELGGRFLASVRKGLETMEPSSLF